MYKVKVTRHFSGAHFLREYKGKCENLHGHRLEKIHEMIRDRVGKYKESPLTEVFVSRSATRP